MNMTTPFKQYATALLLALGSTAAMGQSVTYDTPVGDDIVALSSLDLSTVTYYNDSGKNGVIANKTTFSGDLVVRDTLYTCGVGTHAPSKFVVEVNGAKTFHARFGIDDGAALNSDNSIKTNEGIVDFTVTAYADDKTATTLSSGTIKRTDASSFHIDVDLSNARYLVINFDQGAQSWSDHVDVCDAYFTYADELPKLISESSMWSDASKVVDIPTAPDGVEYIPLSSLEISKATCGWSTIKANKSIDGNAILLDGYTYTSGVGTHSPSQIIVKLNGSVTRFHAVVGLDDEVLPNAANTNQAQVDYNVTLKAQNGDTKVMAEGSLKGTAPTYPEIDIDVNGWKYLILNITNGADGTNGNDHVDWGNAYLEFQEQNSTRPCIVSAEEISAQLDCATTVFSQPGVRFMHKVRPTSSEATVTVKGLPDGLTWNEKRQLVEGTVNTCGTYTYQADITIDGETTTQDITFNVSDELQQPTPFMGWVSWNSVQSEVSEDIVKKMADLFESKELYNCGWNTILLDDWWHAASRTSDGKPQPNATRFPNGIKAVADYVHDKGMHFGLYTDAATATCAGAFGSYGNETVDANQYAEWGVDIVKCDYCNAPSSAEEAQKRYKALADAFKASGRDIILYICEWGVREPWKWGAEVGGSCWRISQDVRDCWKGSGSGVGVLQSIEAMKGLANWQGVNRFNDADMLCTGLHGTGKSSNDLCATGPGMTQDEYRTQFALWCMWSSPMALSFDPRSTALTDDDYAIMGNQELIAVNQDRMGQQADLISEDNDMVIFAKDCENGDIVVSFTNLSSSAQSATLDFNTLPHLNAAVTYTCRDLWNHTNLADAKGSLTTTVASHATQVFRLSDSSQTNGITAAPAAADEITVGTTAQGISVRADGTQGLAKRILVSDTLGRVVATATTAGERYDVRLPKGIYMVQVTADAHATLAKVKL